MKIKGYCRDCGEPLEKKQAICPKCREERTKERMKRYKYY